MKEVRDYLQQLIEALNNVVSDVKEIIDSAVALDSKLAESEKAQEGGE